jgi:UDP-4-amino-4,6-dideoxy-N-acetyl-beta-L-altrosamine N-acetyltransferase
MICFTKMQEHHQEQVLSWRMQPDVTRFMNSDPKPDIDKQYQWFKSISQNDQFKYWVIEYQEKPIGVFNLAAIDTQSRKCNAGYYIGEVSHYSLGGVIPPYFYNHIFCDLKLNKVYGEVFEENEAVLKLHDYHGYQRVGVWREHVYKNGRYHNIINVELMSVDWLKQKKYRKYVAEWDR